MKLFLGRREEWSMEKKIYIVRHCKAEGQESDAKLTDLGVRQAKQLVEFFMEKEIDYIVSSPYVRAHSSIIPLANYLNLHIEFDSRLVERVLTGGNHINWRDMLLQTYDDLDVSFEGGESSNEAMNRAISVSSEIVSSKHKNSIIVSHGNLISLILKYFDPRVGFKEWESMSNPDVFQLAFVKDTPSIERIWKDQ